VVSLGLLAGIVPLAAWSGQAGATTSRSPETVRCVAALTKHGTLIKSTLVACTRSSLIVTHPCPRGSSTIFVMRRGTTYAPRVGHKPMKLAMQYGMGTITQACGSTTTPHEPATTATTGVPLAPSTTTVPPPPPTTAAPASCTPLSDSGICYEPGEYCRDSDHGATGRAGDGESITCEDNDGVAVGAVVTFHRPAPDNASTTPSGVDEMRQWAVEKPIAEG